MKQTVLSVLLAVFLLIGSLGVFASANDIEASESLIKFYAYGEGLDTTKNVVLYNHYNAQMNLTLAGELSYNSDNSQKLNISNQDITLSPINSTDANKTVGITLLSTGVSDAESGTYKGNLNIVNKDTGATIKTVPVEVIVPGLKITKVTSSDTSVERGQSINVTVDYKNLGKVGYLDDMELIELSIKNKKGETIDNIDGDSLEVTSEDLSRLKYGNTDSYSTEFTLPFDFEGSSLNIYAKVKGCNEEYTAECFEVEYNKSITVDIKDDKVIIEKAAFSPSVVECDNKRAKVTAEIKNVGDKYEYIQLVLKNQATGSERILNSGDELRIGDDFTDEQDYTLNFEEYVNLNELKQGANPYTLYVDFGTKTPASKEMIINLLACETAQPTTTTTTTTTPTTTQPTTPTQQTTPTTPVTPVQPVTNPSYVTLKDVSGVGFGSDWVIPAVIGAGGLIIGLVVALLVMPRP